MRTRHQTTFSRARKRQKSKLPEPQAETFSAAISAGITAYDRERDLPRLLSLWPHEIEDEATNARLAIIQKLRWALRTEKRRADAGHWGYDLNRHLALFCAYKSEQAALAKDETPPIGTAPKQERRGKRAPPLSRGTHAFGQPSDRRGSKA